MPTEITLSVASCCTTKGLGDYSRHLKMAQYTTPSENCIVVFVVLRPSDWSNKSYIKKTKTKLMVTENKTHCL